MSDLISRQAVDDAIYDYSRSCDVNYAQIMEYIDKLPSVENKGEWIPVSEKLPSDCGHDWVLAQIQEDNGYLWIPCVAEYREFFDDWFSEANEVGWLSNHKGAFKVIAWMPLPEPYKAEKTETCKGCLEPCIMYEPDMRACNKKVTERGEE